MAREDTHLTQTGAEVQALLDKVEGIEEGAQVNKIDSIVVDGQAMTPSPEGILDMSNAMGYRIDAVRRTAVSPAYYEVVGGSFAAAAEAFSNKRPVYLFKTVPGSEDAEIAVAQRAVLDGGVVTHIYFVEQDGDTVLLYDFDGSVPTRIELPDYMPIPDDAWDLTAQGGVRTKGAGNAAGEYGTAEGLYTSAANAAHSEGMGTIAGNAFSHAEGRYNHSEAVTSVFGHRGNTHHSIGIGTSDVDRKNAIEVKQNGDVYMIGIGGYNGKNWDNAQTVQTSLEAAYQKPQYGIPESDLDYSVTEKLREKVQFNSLPSSDMTSVDDLDDIGLSRNDLLNLADGNASALIYNQQIEYGLSESDYAQTECIIKKASRIVGDRNNKCELTFVLNGYEYAITADYDTEVATVTVTAVVLPDATNMQSYSYGATAPSEPKEGDIWVSETLTEIPISENADELTFTKTASRYKLTLSGLANNDSAVFEWYRASDSKPFNSALYKPDGTYYFDAPDYEIKDNELYLSLTYTDDLWEVATLWAVANTVYQYHNGSWVAMEVVTATEKAAWNAKYSKPSGGIPSTDLASGVIPDISGKADAATTLAGYGITDAYTKTEVDGKVSSAYKAAGTVASVASLGTLDAAHEGFVYNMSASFTTTSDFVEGSDTTYPAGTNVAIVNTGTTSSPVYKYDVLAGFVDISGKADKAEMSVVDGTDANADKTTITLKSGTSATVLKSHQDISGKADKVSSATNGHLAALDSNGNLTDSGKSASDLAVEANPTVPSGTTPTALTGLKIGNSYYSAPSVVALTNNEIDTIWTNAS